MKRVAILIYGFACYLVFFATFLYAIWFVYTLDQPAQGATSPLLERLVINAALLSVFALQHSVMARQGFKRVWTRVIPEAAERST
jgi:hypothetical protein